MFALEWLKNDAGIFRGDRLAASLEAGQARSVGRFRTTCTGGAALLDHGDPVRARGWRPTTVGPLLVLFAGHITNSDEIAPQLGLPGMRPGDQSASAMLYGKALLKWGEQADRRLIGEYATAVLNEASASLRLARSPLRAPPLHYFADDERVIASTLVRAIFACGVEQRLDEDKIADMAWFNAGLEERGWFRDLRRVPLGSTVNLTPGSTTSTRYYDIGALPRLPRRSTQDYLAEAHDLLAEGTRAALAGCNRPALMLSGGLDSSLVAVKSLDALPGSAELNTYTFVPEPGWTASAFPGRFCDERPFVEAFCAMHPRLVPHYHDNAEAGFDARLNELFFAIGGAPQGLANLHVYHSLWQAAKADGCDRVLLGEFGNLTASADGSWAFSEYFLRIRWRQLYRALHELSDDNRGLWRRFVALALLPFLPDRLWHWQRAARGVANQYELASPLRRDYALSSGAIARAKAAGLPNPRYPLRDRLATMKEVHSNTWGEFSDIYAGFTQLYGLEQRDPTAYRPFFEFCAGLPSDMFLRDGQQRWMAREMLRGVMPEEQRTTPRTGRHNADWHVKLTRQRENLLREIDELARVPRLATMLDLDRARAALEDWPANDAVSAEDRLIRESAIPRTIIAARFINYIEGRN